MDATDALSQDPAMMAGMAGVADGAGGVIDGATLRSDLRRLGLRRGMIVLAHSSLREVGRAGRVEGGAGTLCDALLSVVGKQVGTLVVPAQTRSKSETSAEFRAAVAGLDATALAAYRANLPGFDRSRSPAEGMGALAEAVRVYPGAHRSAHPLTSFAAVGANAAECCASHPVDCLLGKASPLGYLYDVAAQVLLLGVGFDKCTAFHLGEYAAFHDRRRYRCKVGDTWVRFDDLPYRDTDFTTLGERFVRAHGSVIRCGRVGGATALLFPLTVAADFAAAELPALRFGSGEALGR